MLPTYALTEDLLLVGLSAFIRNKKTLVITDLHLGYERELHSKGILVPKTQSDSLFSYLSSILAQVDPKTIIVAGDLINDFGDPQWRDAVRFFDLMKGRQLILIKGNHDSALVPVAKKHHIPLRRTVRLGHYLMVHGDTIPQRKGIRFTILGHEHPALVLSTAVRSERYKCFVYGKWGDGFALILPSMNPLVEGTDIREHLGPFPPAMREKKYFVVGEKIYAFPAKLVR